MQQEQTSATPAGPTSFAGLLAALTGARSKFSADAPDPLDDLAEDVATLSYERALQTHARYRPAGAADRASGVASSARASAAKPAAPRADRGQSRREASITVRMSRAECAQLQQRAAEAGMTISAYLRSCTLEVESLRAQVKHTLAELRAMQTPAPKRARLPWLRLGRKPASQLRCAE